MMIDNTGGRKEVTESEEETKNSNEGESDSARLANLKHTDSTTSSPGQRLVHPQKDIS